MRPVVCTNTGQSLSAEIPDRQVIYAALLLLTVVGGLITYKTTASLGVIENVFVTGTLKPRPNVIPFVGGSSQLNIPVRTLNYFSVVWVALLFGVLIGGAVRAFISPRWLAGLLGGGTIRPQLIAGLAGAPLMLCYCGRSAHGLRRGDADGRPGYQSSFAAHHRAVNELESGRIGRRRRLVVRGCWRPDGRFPLSLPSDFGKRRAVAPQILLSKGMEKERSPEMNRIKTDLTTLSSVLMLIVTLALSAQAQQPPRFSDWSAPVNLGPPVNTAAFEG